MLIFYGFPVFVEKQMLNIRFLPIPGITLQVIQINCFLQWLTLMKDQMCFKQYVLEFIKLDVITIITQSTHNEPFVGQVPWCNTNYLLCKEYYLYFQLKLNSAPVFMHIPAKGKAKRGDSYDIQRYWQFSTVNIVCRATFPDIYVPVLNANLQYFFGYHAYQIVCQWSHCSSLPNGFLIPRKHAYWNRLISSTFCFNEVANIKCGFKTNLIVWEINNLCDNKNLLPGKMSSKLKVLADNTDLLCSALNFIHCICKIVLVFLLLFC